MNRYRCRVPRAALGCAAVAMTTLTMGAMVVLPSKMEDGSQTFAVFAAPPHVDASCVAPPRIVRVGESY